MIRRHVVLPLFASTLLVGACSEPVDKGDENNPVVINNGGGGGDCSQFGGVYSVSEYQDGSDCGWETDENSYEMTITQTGCNASMDFNGNVISGTVGNGAISASGSVNEEDGTFSFSDQQISIGSDGAMQGTIDMDYVADDGSLSCTYSITVTGTRISSANNGGGNNGGGNNGGGGPLTLEQQVVGAWAQGGTCNGDQIQVGLFVCPGGRIRGAKSLGGYDFLVCGTWEATPPDQIASKEKLIAVIDPDDPANNTVYDNKYTYEWDGDQLVWNGGCNIPMQRLEGGVSAEDCESSACSEGGSGAVQCGTDCDCGRCNYCESGTCRYGGEGPYGCYRGCSD